MQNGTLPAPNFYPLTNTTEVLNGNTVPGAFSVGNDLLRYYVVHVAGETLFLARQFPQSAVCRCRMLLLELVRNRRCRWRTLFTSLPLLPLAIRVGGDVGDSQVNAEEAIDPLLRFRDFACRRKIEHSVSEDQIALTFLVLEQRQLGIARKKSDMQAASDGPDGDGLLGDVPIQDTEIVGDGSGRLERPHGLPIQLVAVRNFRNTPHHNLSGECELLAGFAVGEPVDVELSEALRRPRSIADPIATFVGGRERIEQTFRLLVRGCEL